MFESMAPATVPDDLDQADRRLWVVRDADVVHADELCGWGQALETGKIKHSNLTGGAPAYSGGELIALNDNTIVLNGCSGRYGPQSAAEMQRVAEAFTKSGYYVWSCGFDEEAGRPLPFGLDALLVEL
jgi:hypothetical protein